MIGLCTESVLTSCLEALGGSCAIFYLYKLFDLIRLHFLRSSALGAYQKNSERAWALVTGASDGIGKGFAEELCSRGFNVIIHGRNREKLGLVRDGLLQQWPNCEVRVLVLDAVANARESSRLEEVSREVAGLNLKLLVNNVGGSGGLQPGWLEFVGRDASDTAMLIDLNAMFPTQVTRVILPHLIKSQPAVVLNVGSVCSEVPSPYAGVYAGAKAYNKAWSRSLALEMVAEGHAVEILTVLVGEVSSGSQPQALGFFCPSSRRMAGDSLNKLGCGRDVVWGYWPHQLQFDIVLGLPRWLMEKIVLSMVHAEKDKERAELGPVQQVGKAVL